MRTHVNRRHDQVISGRSKNTHEHNSVRWRNTSTIGQRWTPAEVVHRRRDIPNERVGGREASVVASQAGSGTTRDGIDGSGHF